jgi:hypothetical protein
VELHKGEVDRSQLSASLNNEVTTKALAGMHARFARLDTGTEMRWIYKGQERAVNGSISYSYRVLLSNGYTLTVATTIDKAGRISECDTAYD